MSRFRVHCRPVPLTLRPATQVHFVEERDRDAKSLAALVDAHDACEAANHALATRVARLDMEAAERDVRERDVRERDVRERDIADALAAGAAAQHARQGCNALRRRRVASSAAAATTFVSRR